MSRQEEIIKERIKKIDELRKHNVNPYPHKFDRTYTSAELKEKFSETKTNSTTKNKASVAGRVMIIRDIGKIIFAKLRDGSGDIQIVLQDGKTSGKEFELFRKYIDSGDFIGATGVVGKTKTGELSVIVEKIELLSKSILPLPEKWHGLTDKEERYRKRYIDLAMNPDVRKVFETRERIIDVLRGYLKEEGFLEVETPALQPLYGGAEAQPFVTNLKALNMKLYLSISPELYLKKLLIGGIDKVFTICKNFRNEGIDKFHNPEFTMMEAYASYWDYNEVMEMTEEILSKISKEVYGKTKIIYQGVEIDFTPPFKKYTLYEAIKKLLKIDVENLSAEEFRKKAAEFNIDTETKADIIAKLFDEKVQPLLVQPTFITDYPKEICPLTKEHRKDKELVERFELFVNGTELANAYSELNDPIEQEARLKKQVENRKKSKDFDAHLEAQKVDTGFVEAMMQGMPPAGGIGIGIDRLTLFFTNSPSIRDVILFPFMKPEGEKAGK